jgi:hypothetical protein
MVLSVGNVVGLGKARRRLVAMANSMLGKTAVSIGFLMAVGVLMLLL